MDGVGDEWIREGSCGGIGEHSMRRVQGDCGGECGEQSGGEEGGHDGPLVCVSLSEATRRLFGDPPRWMAASLGLWRLARGKRRGRPNIGGRNWWAHHTTNATIQDGVGIVGCVCCLFPQRSSIRINLADTGKCRINSFRMAK